MDPKTWIILWMLILLDFEEWKTTKIPLCVESRTEFLIMFMGCPLLWISKLQTQVALSNMASNCIALSHYMCELIAVREILKEVSEHVFLTHLALTRSIEPFTSMDKFLSLKFMKTMRPASNFLHFQRYLQG